MVRFTAPCSLLVLLASGAVEGQSVDISRSETRAVRQGQTEHVTGRVRVEMLFEAREPSRASGGTVTFAVQWMEHVSDEQYNGSAPDSELQAGSSPETPSAVLPGAGRPSGPRQQTFAPGLAALTDDVLYGDVWRRTELSARDRSLVTVAVLIATGKPAQLVGHLGRALDSGVQPSEASGLLAHLAIYCGWPNAVTALDVYEQVYRARMVDTGTLRAVGPRLPAPASDATRARAVTDELGTVAPKFVQLTNDVVFSANEAGSPS